MSADSASKFASSSTSAEPLPLLAPKNGVMIEIMSPVAADLFRSTHRDTIQPVATAQVTIIQNPSALHEKATTVSTVGGGGGHKCNAAG